MRADAGARRRTFRHHPRIRQSKCAQPHRAADGQSQDAGRKGRRSPLVAMEPETQAARFALRLQRPNGWRARHANVPHRWRSRNTARSRAAEPLPRTLSLRRDAVDRRGRDAGRTCICRRSRNAGPRRGPIAGRQPVGGTAHARNTVERQALQSAGTRPPKHPGHARWLRNRAGPAGDTRMQRPNQRADPGVPLDRARRRHPNPMAQGSVRSSRGQRIRHRWR